MYSRRVFILVNKLALREGFFTPAPRDGVECALRHRAQAGLLELGEVHLVAPGQVGCRLLLQLLVLGLIFGELLVEGQDVVRLYHW